MHATLFRQDVVLARPIAASAQEHARRSRLFLCLEDHGILGYGEVAPQPSALNGDPGLDEVVGAARGSLAQLAEVVAREGTLPSWRRVSGFGAATPANNVATALVEM